MRRTTLALALSAFGTCLLLGANAASADSKGKGHDDNSLTIRLKGSEEAPVVISSASGTLDLDINEAAGSIAYELNYADLEGNVTQAHIHIGQRNVSGGIALWLCQTAAAPAPVSPPANPAVAATPQCPGPHSGTVRNGHGCQRYRTGRSGRTVGAMST